MRRGASGSAAPAAAAEVVGRPGEETAQEGLRRRERSANEKKCQTSLRTIVGYTYICKGASSAAWTAAGRRLE